MLEPFARSGQQQMLATKLTDLTRHQNNAGGQQVNKTHLVGNHDGLEAATKLGSLPAIGNINPTNNRENSDQEFTPTAHLTIDDPMINNEKPTYSKATVS